MQAAIEGVSKNAVSLQQEVSEWRVTNRNL